MTVKGSGLLKEGFNDSHPTYTPALYEGAQTGFLEQSCDTEQIRASIRIKGAFYIQINFKSLLSHLDIHAKAEC